MRIENEREHRRLIGQVLEERNQVVTVTQAHTINDGDRFILADATGGAFTVTLPTAVGRKGKPFTVIRTNSGANAVTVDGDGSETINGAANVSLSSQYDRVTVISDNTNWLRTD